MVLWTKEYRSQKNREYRQSKPDIVSYTPEYTRDYQKTWSKKNPEKYLLSQARRRARDTGKEFTIELSDIIIPSHCPILGTELREVREHDGVNGLHTPSVDRKDNSKGYVKGNVFVISSRANSLKRDLTLDIVKKLYDYLSSDS